VWKWVNGRMMCWALNQNCIPIFSHSYNNNDNLLLSPISIKQTRPAEGLQLAERSTDQIEGKHNFLKFLIGPKPKQNIDVDVDDFLYIIAKLKI
jgi:hypothetical protein